MQKGQGTLDQNHQPAESTCWDELQEELHGALAAPRETEDVDLQLYLEYKDQGRVCLTKENVDKIKPGDVLDIKYYLLCHLIVVESVRTQPDKPPDFVIIEAIHYGRPNLLTPNRIIRETFELNLATQECWLQLLPPSSCYPPDTVLQRARSRLNEQQHSPISNNAAQFALWCKTESPTHRPESLVPIFLSDKHEIHTVKIGDHLQLKCNGQEVHGEVTDVAELKDLTFTTILISGKEVQNDSISILHQITRRVTQGVLKVISTSPRIDSDELSRRVQLLNKFSFKDKTSSLPVCLLLTDTTTSGEVWRQGIRDAAHRYPTSTRREEMTPTMLRAGDVIHWQGVYRVVTNVTPDGPAALVTTVQYCSGPVEDTDGLFEMKVLIDKKETDTMLCVHNDVHEDCQLYGGGRDKPSYSAVKVTDVSQIHSGSVISMRSSGFYQHAVVISESADIQPAAGDSAHTRASLQVMAYVLDPALSTEQFEIALRNVDIDISEKDVYVLQYRVAEDRKYSASEVVARAFSRQGERQHNLQWNNGRDFARWCSIKHPSNREQCRVPIKSAQQLVEFQRGHIKFLKCPGLYTHDAILRECSYFEGSDEIVEVRLYENSYVFRIVRAEALKIDDGESVQRVNYESCVLLGQDEFGDLNHLMNRTFLNSADENKLWTAVATKCGSRVTSQDFCYWLKTKSRYGNGGLQEIEWLFGAQLSSIQEYSKTLAIEDNVSRNSLRPGDHVILTRKVLGKNAEVHFILTEWNEQSGTGTGVTYEMPTEVRKIGFQEFNGFLRVTGPGQLEKVVHNSELKWDSIDAKFKECQGTEKYKVLTDNCEHFVNFLIYGRFTSLQVCGMASKASGFVGPLSRLVQLVIDLSTYIPDGGTLLAEGASVGLMVVLSVIEAIVLTWRKATTGMSNNEYEQRLLSILSYLGFSTAGLAVGISIGTNGLLPILGIVALLLGWALPKLPAVMEALTTP